MNKLLAYQYLDNSINNSHWFILALLHELRVVTPKQLLKLINLSMKFDKSTLYKKLIYLKDAGLVDYIYEDTKNSNRCYFLTRTGHQTVGGIYTFPKVPEYNLKHHLEVTNYLIESLDKVNDLDSFMLAISERRQVYEKKDMSTNKKGSSYHVADFILQFKKDRKKINWHFEIELTLKSRRRYMNSIFPKYMNLLNQNIDNQLIYVSPSPLIKKELETFKNYFKVEKSKGNYEKINADIFNRLHIFSHDNFSSELDKLIEKNILTEEGK